MSPPLQSTSAGPTPAGAFPTGAGHRGVQRTTARRLWISTTHDRLNSAPPDGAPGIHRPSIAPVRGSAHRVNPPKPAHSGRRSRRASVSNRLRPSDWPRIGASRGSPLTKPRHGGTQVSVPMIANWCALHFGRAKSKQLRQTYRGIRIVSRINGGESPESIAAALRSDD